MRERGSQGKGLAVVAGLVVAGLLAAMLVDSPRGTPMARLCLSLLFLGFLAGALHDLGHAGAAALLGLRVESCRLGYGPTLLSGALRGVPVEVCLLPLCGAVTWRGAPSTAPRLRRALVSWAGPLVSGGLGGGVWALAASTPGQPAPATVFAGISLFLALGSGLPWRFPADMDLDAPWADSDGLQALRSLFAEPERVRSWAREDLRLEVAAQLRRGDASGAAARLAGAGDARDSCAAGAVALAREDWGGAGEHFERALDRGEHVLALTGLARVARGLGDLEGSARHARGALSLDHDADEARRVWVAVLLDQGRVGRAEALLQPLREGGAPWEQAEVEALLARARLAAGDRASAERHLARALELDSRASEAERARQELEA